MNRLKIGVTSENRLKVDAVAAAYAQLGIAADVQGYQAESGVGEQPVNEQTVEGARNRIHDLQKRTDSLDRIVSIENGIFRERDQWIDRAVVVIYEPDTGREDLEYSEAVVFPDVYVEQARQIGFERMTVGQVMAEAGYITDKKDPHQSISGRSRKDYLEKAVQKLVERVEKNRK